MAFFRHLLARLARDTRGNVLPIVGAALIPLTIMIGSGIDVSRAYMAKSKMQSACDAASLAARRVLKNDTLDQNVRDTATDFFNFNFPKNLYGTATVAPVVTKPSAGVIRIAADTTIPTVVMNLFGFGSLPLSVNCDASLNFVNTDIVLVLDVTASMAQSLDGTDKIDALEEAVLALYDELTPIQTQLQSQGLRLRYGIVPYSSTVNVGRLLYAKNSGYIASKATVPSRVANMTEKVYAANTPTESSGWEVASSTLADWECEYYWVGASNQSGGGPAPTPTTVTRYQGTSSSSGYNKSQNWGWSGASDTSGTRRSCRRWKRVETTTYTTRYAFKNWTHQQVEYDVSNFIKPGGSLNYAINGSGTIASSMSYDPQKLAINATGASTSNATWNGCIVERKTTLAINGGTSLTIPSDAKDLDLDLIPSDDDTRWRPMVPELGYKRSPSSNSQNYDNGPSDKQWMLDYSPSQGFTACPTEARRLAEWDRTSLKTYLEGLQTVGGTYHDIGMIWGGRFISTGGVFGDGCDFYASMPCNRHVIFMTDGDQTAYCDVYGSYGIERNDKRVLGANNCEGTDQNNAVIKQLVARHEQRFRMACNATKNLGASVWVIGFDTALNSNLTGCASSPNQADTAGNKATLIAKFREIGNQIGALRLTE